MSVENHRGKLFITLGSPRTKIWDLPNLGDAPIWDLPQIYDTQIYLGTIPILGYVRKITKYEYIY